MISFYVNGAAVTADNPDRLLIRFLRDEMRLTSVKEGCSEGACGTCMVLLDGKSVKACIVKLGRVEGRHVLTVEGLSGREKDIYRYCFGTAGAVQCGFCIPGMVISAKALLDANPDPSRVEVKRAINGNICRCTGYVKIEEAILMAGRFFREDLPVPEVTNKSRPGDNFIRVDAAQKTDGTGIYTDDMTVEGMVFAKALRTQHPRARILSIGLSKAKAHPDCIDIFTANDVPGNIKCGHLVKDWDALIAQGDVTRYIGDAIAIAVSETADSLDEILALIETDYDVLIPVTSPEAALKAGAARIHEGGNILFEQVLSRGNADEAIANSAHAVTEHYSLPFTEHAFMEPECAIAMPDENDGLILYTGSQSIYDEQREISSLLGIDPGKVRVRSMLVGGGFGGKEDMSVQHHAALCAYLLKKPVKIKLSRAESMMVHPKRHAMEIDITTACDENGIITAVKARLVSDTGAYASLGGPVLQRACTHLGGPYNFQNIDIKGTAVYTNNPPGGAFRGFGVTQSCFAMESNLNLLAEKTGISPWEIRYRNAVSPGQVLPNGQIADETTAIKSCLLAVRDAFEVSESTGIACAFKNSGLGVGVPDTGRCIISVHNGKVHVRSSAACIGQGLATVLTQLVSAVLDVSADMIIIEPPDTSRTPNSGTTTASRQTLFAGEAAVRAAGKLKQAIGAVCEQTLKDIEGAEFYGEYKPQTDPIGSDKQNPVSHVAYGYAAQVAQLDKQGRLIKVTAAYDLGAVINPIAAQGQIEGGIAMGIGYALTEDFPLCDGRPRAKYGTLGLLRATQMPDVETILIDSGINPAGDAFGAKGVGELATIPAAPAITGAYLRYGGKVVKKLPMRQEGKD